MSPCRAHRTGAASRLRPLAIEFWHGRPNRLHERHLFRRATVTDGIWTMERLSP
ncbi:MAG: pyridoxine 5'-phosphate oxidase C-terminal domain-containing protein [Thermoanaerobaculia bacterium]